MKTNKIISNNKLFNLIFKQLNSPQFKKYLVTGFTSFGIEYTIYGLLYKIIFKNYQPFFYNNLYTFTQNISTKYFNTVLSQDSFRALISNIFVYFVVFWVVFLLNRHWTFKAKENFSRQIFLYIILFIFNLIVPHSIIFSYLNQTLSINPMISKIIVMGFVVIWNFTIYKKVIYKK